MPLFSKGVITQIATDNPDVYAFKVSGHIDDDASEALAEFMNAVFDARGTVSMLLDLSDFTGSDWDSMLDTDVIKSRFRALTHVKRYGVVGAPDGAAKMITLMNKIIPVEAGAFEAKDIEMAWEFVGAHPLDENQPKLG
ncbi:STAS/SEC14 domain-containing protein [Roseobacter sp. CCS2]|uniref:STAS/SEC14 domain-containing protein n=1 Tax=Roseobacter sp. CCS2 TaxID=391593 RepID=UPI0000F3F09A|nr:STAS/SEC14 domain-containing protein [Roseobacter sp. CCS2]EBA11136.1 hypothetical protein RCCS2_10205 [Roseobacter sp. CCS2]